MLKYIATIIYRDRSKESLAIKIDRRWISSYGMEDAVTMALLGQYKHKHEEFENAISIEYYKYESGIEGSRATDRLPIPIRGKNE